MSYTINRAAVIGAGTMGAAIAAHLANVGIPSYLLDIVPRAPTEKEQEMGLTLDDPAVRNRIVNEGFERCVKARPANFYTQDGVRLITLGNLDDNFDWIAEADWIVEAIVERLDIKQQLMARIDEVRRPDSIVSTNTSGIPIHQIADGRSESFQQHFLGTHFFNPPRYLKLLEIIPHAKNSPELVAFMKEFGTTMLGKGVVICKDTPNFVANRMISIAGSHGFAYALDSGYTFEEVDAITGPAIGRPKTGTFRLNDLVGIDVMEHVGRNLYDAIPHDPYREVLRHEKMGALTATMVEKGWLGNKSGQGFYKRTFVDGERQFWILNPDTMEYEPPVKPRFDSVGKALKADSPAEKLKIMAYADDRAGQYAWHLLTRTAVYAAACIPEISDDIVSVDNACKWGFVWELGPFETWDAIGVGQSVERLKAEGVEIPAWVEEMLAGGFETFYQQENGVAVGYYDPATKGYKPILSDPKIISIQALKAAGKELHHNESASLIDMGEGVLLLEFHSRAANALDPYIFDMFSIAQDELKKDQWVGMVIGNQGRHFSAGANIFTMVVAAQQEEFETIDQGVRQMQHAMMSMRYSPKPVVAAVFGMALAGGCEVVLAASRVVAAAETYTGLIEVGVGLIPAGCGCKEMVRRVISPPMKTKDVQVLPFLQRAWEQIGLGKVSTSAAEAREMKILADCDRIVANQDHLLAEAKQTVLDMVRDGYRPPAPEQVYAAGRDAYAALEIGLHQLHGGGYASDHDVLIGKTLGYILTGGELSAPAWVDEQVILDLERDAFVSLCHEKKTVERMWYMLQNRKPLRN
jgi:3-hydroxyacyl-CoA dehydrogenase